MYMEHCVRPAGSQREKNVAEFFDYDPATGIRHDFEYDEATGNATIFTTEDVEPLLKHAATIRNNNLADDGIKESWFHYAYLPLSIMLKMKFEKGINAFDPREQDRVIKEINENYPHLKTTTKHVGGKQRQIYIP